MKPLKHLRAHLAWAGERLRVVWQLPVLGPGLRVAVDTVKGFIRDDGLVMAAAISFYSILSLIPFLLLLLSVAGFLLQHLGQDAVSQQQLYAQIEGYVRAVVPFLGDDLLERLRELTARRGAYGITGLVFIMVTAGLVFRSLELAYARIFDTPRRRSLMKSQLLFIVFLMALGLLLLGVHYLGVLSSSFYSARNSNFAQNLDFFLARHVLMRVLITVVVSSGVFVVLLKYFSREKVSLRHAAAGGLLFSAMWMLAVRLFGLYLEHVARFSLIYGSLATLAVMVVWIFYSACILLLCTEFCSVLRKRSLSGG